MRIVIVLIVVAAALPAGMGCAHCRDAHDKPASATTSLVARDDSAGIRIESARYGRDDTWVDVTPQVRGLVSGDTLVFPRNLVTTLNVDPVPGRMKYVDMVMIVDGRVIEMTLGDSLHVTPLRFRAGGGGGSGAVRPVDGGAATKPKP